MTILVLGGARYIESHTVYALIEKGEDVVIIDNLETGHAIPAETTPRRAGDPAQLIASSANAK